MKYLALAVVIRDIARAEMTGRATPQYLESAAEMLRVCIEEPSLLVESDEMFGPGDEIDPDSEKDMERLTRQYLKAFYAVFPEVQELEYPQE